MPESKKCQGIEHGFQTSRKSVTLSCLKINNANTEKRKTVRRKILKHVI